MNCFQLLFGIYEERHTAVLRALGTIISASPGQIQEDILVAHRSIQCSKHHIEYIGGGILTSFLPEYKPMIPRGHHSKNGSEEHQMHDTLTQYSIF
jgi:hypothetical protein